MALDLQPEFEEIVQRQLERFGRWCADEWSVSEKDRLDEFFRERSDDYVEGYNASLASLPDALSSWLEIE